MGILYWRGLIIGVMSLLADRLAYIWGGYNQGGLTWDFMVFVHATTGTKFTTFPKCDTESMVSIAYSRSYLDFQLKVYKCRICSTPPPQKSVFIGGVFYTTSYIQSTLLFLGYYGGNISRSYWIMVGTNYAFSTCMHGCVLTSKEVRSITFDYSSYILDFVAVIFLVKIPHWLSNVNLLFQYALKLLVKYLIHFTTINQFLAVTVRMQKPQKLIMTWGLHAIYL